MQGVAAMTQTDSQSRLNSLFRELFQLDVADLDFGLYRIFRLKRAEVEIFLREQLPKEIGEAFATAATAEREALKKSVSSLAQLAQSAIHENAILPNGQPNPEYLGMKAVKEYAEELKRLEAVEGSETQRADVFNLLYEFFARYYDNGDFIPHRFYGRASYAVPYSGEEVFFHWANRDQLYIKTGETFRDYVFTVSTVSGDYRVRFVLAEATVPRDNTKGDVRFFFPVPQNASFDTTTNTLTIPCEYRLPTREESGKYGNISKAQQAIIKEATPRLLEQVAAEVLRTALAERVPTGREEEGEEVPSLLHRRLTHFTKNNTTDYFVHQNLGVFLRQELEFFVRDQVVHEADLEGDFDAKRRTIRVFRKLAESIITFLTQIEEAQKTLFLKKKLVIGTQYIVSMQNVPRSMWSEVLANKAQLEEWKELYGLSPKSSLFNFENEVNEHVLEQNPTLLVDTKHFPAEFTARLLESFDDIDDCTDGVLIHSENFQAISIIQSRYREGVDSIYIDPP